MNAIYYSRKIWLGIKFGSLVVYIPTAKLKSAKNFLLAYICIVIPYRTAKFKSTNIFPIAILGSTTKFNYRQYFRLYIRYVLDLLTFPSSLSPGAVEQLPLLPHGAGGLCQERDRRWLCQPQPAKHDETEGGCGQAADVWDRHAL